MLKSRKHVFWEALIIAIFILGIGIMFGISVEGERTQEISELYLKAEINLLDVEIQTQLLEFENLNCEEIIKKNIEFADRVYYDALTLEQYEDVNSLTDSLASQHKRYDLLRTILWLNSIKIKEKCGEDSFHTVVYLYEYKTQDLEQEGKQIVFSNFLSDLKDEEKEAIILIPIARNLNISSLELLTKHYGINETSIIVDEDLIIYELADLNNIKEYID